MQGMDRSDTSMRIAKEIDVLTGAAERLNELFSELANPKKKTWWTWSRHSGQR